MVALTACPAPQSCGAMASQAPMDGLLNHLRFAAMACRSKPRVELFEACALLHVDRATTVEAHVEALVRCLPQALGAGVRWYAPGTTERSFDEAWLVQLAEACAGGSTPSVQFLLRSRVGLEHRRLLRFLVERVACLPD